MEEYLMRKSWKRVLAISLSALMTILVIPKNITYAEVLALSVSDSVTAAELAQRLVGTGITVSNITFKGNEKAKGVFSGGTGVIGFEDGIILSTGKSVDVIGPNNNSAISTNFGASGDDSLDALMDKKITNDAAVLEFDFVPQNETISFQYVLASDEYNEYLNFADVFGFFVNGKNAAWLPTEPPVPVSIGNVNGNKNSEYYINNDVKIAKLNTQMDGMTVVLSMQAEVKKGEVNHIKLAIADYSDNAVDSSVFIKAGSLTGDVSKPGILGFGKVSYTIEKDVVHASIDVNRVDGVAGTVGSKWESDNENIIENQGNLSFNDGQPSTKLEVSYPYGQSATITLNNPMGGAKINSELSRVYLYSPVYVTGVTSSKENGLYKAGEKINIDITFNEVVHKYPAPPTFAKLNQSTNTNEVLELFLNSGSKAEYVDGFDTKTLTFTYIVNPNDFSKDLDYKDIKSLIGEMYDESSMPVLLTLPEVGSLASISGSKDIVVDAVPPVITLNGDAKITIEQGKDYTELGSKAIDMLDGDITTKIVISGVVKTSTPGEYLVKYTVSDKAGNTAEITRTVVVKAMLPQTGSPIDDSVLFILGLLISMLGIYTIRRKSSKA
jgi:LPXTG-motif cell wall-anchored protein